MNRSASKLNCCSLLATLAITAFGLTGCQTASTGNTQPSASYLNEDVKYFPTGSKFKLDKEAAALQAYNEQTANRVFADEQIRQASGTIPSMNMLPYAQPADEGVTVAAD